MSNILKQTKKPYRNLPKKVKTPVQYSSPVIQSSEWRHPILIKCDRLYENVHSSHLVVIRETPV